MVTKEILQNYAQSTRYTETVKSRAKFLKDMDNYVREHCEDEDNFMLWLRDGVPDGADDSMLEDLAEWDSCWLNCVNAFAEQIKLNHWLDADKEEEGSFY